MPTLTLHHICYNQLNSMTWCATAQFISPYKPNSWASSYQNLAPSIPFAHSIKLYNLIWQIYKSEKTISTPVTAHNKRQQQRYGVRLLLKALLNKLNITDALDDTQFPYRLVNSRHYVCFTHSANKVAVVISARCPVGIDIETQDIAWHVAKRFYHPAEIAILTELSLEQRAIVTKWLWQLKESLIKIHQYKLAQGLGMDYSYIIPMLVENFTIDQDSLIIMNDNHPSYQIALLLQQQTIIIF